MIENETLEVKNPIISSSLCLTKLLGTKAYVRLDKALVHADQWISQDGEIISLTNNTKMVYVYLNSQYSYFRNNNKQYYESQQTISDKLGLNLKTVKSSIKLLKCMGLLYVESVGYRKYKMEVMDLKFIKGILYNNNITTAPEKVKYKNTYEESLVIQKNWDQINKVKSDLTSEYVIVKKEDFDKLTSRVKTAVELS